MVTKTVSWLELFWTITAAIGLIYLVALLWRSYIDYEIVKWEKEDRYHEYAAKTGIFIFVGGTITQMFYLFLGAYAMFEPNPRVIHMPLIAYLVEYFFIFSSVINVLLAIIIYRRR